MRCVLTSVSTSADVGECRRAERRPKFKGKANEKARDDKATFKPPYGGTMSHIKKGQQRRLHGERPG